MNHTRTIIAIFSIMTITAARGDGCPDLSKPGRIKPSHLQTVTDASDPLIANFSWDQAQYMEGGRWKAPAEEEREAHSSFKETSKITDAYFGSKRNSFPGDPAPRHQGACIIHTKHNEWLKRDSGRISNGILIPVNGKIYRRLFHALPRSATYAWRCAVWGDGREVEGILKGVAAWNRVCQAEERSTRDVNAVLDGWRPRPGEIVGLFAYQPTLKEKTNVVWVKVPEYAQKFGGGIVATHTTIEGCTADRPASHWKAVGKKCLPSCGYSKNAYCEKNDCGGLTLARRGCSASGAVGLPTFEPPCCLLGSSGTGAPGGGDEPEGGDGPEGVTPPASGEKTADCRTLRTEIPELQRQLDGQMKAYGRGGGRLKRWFGLKRGSCTNVQRCEILANAIGLARSNPSMVGRIDSYKKRFKKHCKNFDRCRGIASGMAQTERDLNESIRTYNRNCRR